MIWVVIPALDEAENLTLLLPRITTVLDTVDEEWRVLVVDDGSSDDTRGVVLATAAVEPRVDVLSSARNMGKAAALNRGFATALSGGATTVVMMDADGQDVPEEMPRLLEPLRAGETDLVTGARLVRRDRFVKRHTSRLYNGVTRRLSGTPGRDFNSGYKLMRADVAAAVLPMMYGEMHRYLTVLAHQSGYRVSEVPVDHRERMKGQTKYGLARFWRGLADLVTVRFLISYEHRPSHLFGGIGAFCLATGLAVLVYLSGAWVLGESIGDRPLLLAGVLATLVGLQLVLFGLLAELVVHGRQLTLHMMPGVARSHCPDAGERADR